MIGGLRHAAVGHDSLHHPAQRVIAHARPLRRAAGDKIRPARLRHPPERVILRGGAHRTAVKALRIARDLAIEAVEIGQAERAVLGLAVTRKRRRLRQIGRTGGTRRRAAIDAAAEQIGPLRLRAVGADFRNLATEAVVALSGRPSKGAGCARWHLPQRSRHRPSRRRHPTRTKRRVGRPKITLFEPGNHSRQPARYRSLTEPGLPEIGVTA